MKQTYKRKETNKNGRGLFWLRDIQFSLESTLFTLAAKGRRLTMTRLLCGGRGDAVIDAVVSQLQSG